jgi:hypothetical protein
MFLLSLIVYLLNCRGGGGRLISIIFDYCLLLSVSKATTVTLATKTITNVRRFLYRRTSVLTDFNKIWIFTTDFSKTPRYEASRKSVQWETTSSCGRTDWLTRQSQNSSPLGLDSNRAVSSRGICGGHSGPRTVFASSISVLPPVVVPFR